MPIWTPTGLLANAISRLGTYTDHIVCAVQNGVYSVFLEAHGNMRLASTRSEQVLATPRLPRVLISRGKRATCLCVRVCVYVSVRV